MLYRQQALQRAAYDVVVVDHGRVIAQGTPAELTTGPGDQVATFETDAPLPHDASARLHDRLGGDAAWTVEATEATRLRVAGPLDPGALAAVLTWCADEDLLVTRFDLGRRTLEDFFLDLTGRTMR